MALQAHAGLSGLATDLKKAFNNIQRPQWFCLAEHVGIPLRLLQPWQQFLSGFTRRFQVNNNLSMPLLSDVGFAEGDPLSVLAMAVLDWSLHVYMDAMAPPIRTMTFVDNISLLSPDVGHLVLGFFTLQAFLQLWGLQIDVAKSYTWSTLPALRGALAQLGIKIVVDAAELGGSLTLGAARRVRLFLARGSKLSDRWLHLRISRAPLAQKLVCVPAVFWSAALHGSLGCVFSRQHIHDLRKVAIKHLGLQRGGANPLLRLSLATPMTADPGFYHLRTCIFDFRRICSKCPEIAQQWRFFMQNFDGRFTPGPFYKLIDLFGQIGWSLHAPPCFADHDGCLHDLFELSNAALDTLLADAWLQSVAHQVRHRKTMADLWSIDPELVFFDRNNFTASELGQVMALQSGAFITAHQHSKYDVSKASLCSICGVRDDQRHWFDCPRFEHLRAALPMNGDWIDSIPLCTLHHLLPVKTPAQVQMKQYLLALEDTTMKFCSSPGQGPQHLFSDGSFFLNTPKIASVAAWTVVNASTGSITGYGVVPGLRQSISRAELTAVIAAAYWCRHFQHEVYLWSDSNNIVQGVRALLSGQWKRPCSRTEDHDLWQHLGQILEGTPTGFFNICWIPSHMDTVRSSDSWEEWVATWNAVVDDCAVRVNRDRGHQFRSLQEQLQAQYQDNLSKLRALRAFYTGVAAYEPPTEAVVDRTADDTIVLQADHDADSLSDSLAVDWQLQVRMTTEETKFPVSFLVQVFEAICHLEQRPEISFSVSFVELTIWMLTDFSSSVPIWDNQEKVWIFRDYFGVLLRPTVAAILALVRQVVSHGLSILGLQHFSPRAINRCESGIMYPVDGLVLHSSMELSHRLRELTLGFTGTRSIRKVADLAKPLGR